MGIRTHQLGQYKKWLKTKRAKCKRLGANNGSHMTCLHRHCFGRGQGLACDTALEMKHLCCFPYTVWNPNREFTSRAWNRTFLQHHKNMVEIPLKGNNYGVAPQFGVGWRNIWGEHCWFWCTVMFCWQEVETHHSPCVFHVTDAHDAQMHFLASPIQYCFTIPPNPDSVLICPVEPQLISESSLNRHFIKHHLRA